ncbi:unnamed protein product [Chironomus riparius]|uniref:Uncharacterized protein n=1 Tax=Chironomus riparius TaxID=315576 RepID=A0A9N9RPR4_9DIPT|nr:unnamed protein product [Chironomus riparius]
MKIPMVERCCCFELETGGKILGWLGIIFGGIAGLLMLGGLVMVFSLSCDDIMTDPNFQDVTQNFSRDNCTVMKAVVVVILVIVLAVTLVSVIIDVLLIQGISSRNPGKIIPAVVIQAIGFVSTVAKGLFAFSGEGIVSAIIGGAIMFYFFLVLYSLYVKIRDEKKAVQNTQFSQP